MPPRDEASKRQRLENGGRSPRPAQAGGAPPRLPATNAPPAAAAAPEASDEISRLDIDADFKASLREMTPRSRREIINDIVRNQQFARAEEMAAQQNAQLEGRRAAQLRASRDSDSGASDGDMDGFVDNVHAHGPYDHSDDDDDGGMFDEAFDPHPRRRSRGGGGQHGQAGAGHAGFGGGGGGDPFAAMMMQLLQHSLGMQRGRGGRAGGGGGRGGNGAPHPLLVHLQQLLQQREMGLERDIDAMSYEELLALQDRIGYVSKGLRPNEIAGCLDTFCPPKRSGSGSGSGSGGGGSAGSDDTCIICQCALSGDDDGDDDVVGDDDATEIVPCSKLRRCGHTFHKPCVEKWLMENKTCPLCKADVM